MASAKILVVDDDPAIRNLIHRFLSKQNYQLESAEDGKSALAMFEQFNPTLKLFRKQILQRLNYKPIEYFGNISNEQEIERLNVYIFNMEQEIESLKETITKLEKPRNNYNIINNI